MTTPVQTKSVLVSGANNAVIAFTANATLGNFLTLSVSYVDTPVAGTAETLTVPTDANGTWLASKNVAGYGNLVNTIAGGAALFHQTVASAATHSTTVSPPSGLPGNLYALVTITEWPVASFDVAQSNVNNSAASTTGGNSGTTVTLASSADFVVGALSLACTTGLTNAGISDPATGYTASLGVSQNSGATVGAEASYLATAGSTAGQQAALTWTADASMLAYMIVVATYTPSGGGAPNQQYGDDAECAWNAEEHEEFWVADASTSAPVGANAAALAGPQPQDEPPFWWEEYEDVAAEAAEWSVFVQPNAPPAGSMLPADIDWDDQADEDWDLTILDDANFEVFQPNQEDPWPHDDPEGDDWEFALDTAPLGANAAVVPPPCPDDPWEWTENSGDDWESYQAIDAVGPNPIVLAPNGPEDAWDWSEPQDYSDEPPDDDGSNVRNPNQLPLPVEDAWDWAAPLDQTDDLWDDDGYNVQAPRPANTPDDGWDWTSPDDFSDEPPDDDGSNVRNANLVLLPANGAEDAFNWDEEAILDVWDLPMDDGSNVQNGNVVPTPTGLVMPGLIGLNYYEALQVLQFLGIYVPLPVYSFTPSSISVKWLKSSFAGGIVLAQSPLSGVSVVANQPITLTVSTFPFGSMIDSPPDWKQRPPP